MPRYCSIVLGLLLSFPLQASITPNDFAFQARLEGSARDLQRIELPLEVLLVLTRGDLRDLAVFNADGKSLPLTVARTPAARSEQRRSLPFHEFSRFQAEQSKTVTTREQSSTDGALSEIETTQTVTVEARRADYLVELRPDSDTPHFDRIELAWKHEPAEQILELRVEAGNALDNLRVIQARKSLTNRGSDDIGWRSLDRVPRQHRYLRLTPSAGTEHFELLEVSGVYRETRPAPVLRHRLEPVTTEIDGRSLYRFSLPSRVQPAALRILPGEEHGSISGDLWGGDNDFDQARRIHYGFRQHNYSNDGIKPNQPLKLLRQYFPDYWIDSRQTLAATPTVELEYPLYEVIFLGDGRAPYTLAWGNHAFQPVGAGLGEFFEGDLRAARERSALVRLGPVDEAGGSERLQPRMTLPWQKWLLWALLIGAALLTGRMALRLYREMNSPDT